MPLRRFAVFGAVLTHGRDANAVAERNSANGQWFKKMRHPIILLVPDALGIPLSRSSGYPVAGVGIFGSHWRPQFRSPRLVARSRGRKSRECLAVNIALAADPKRAVALESIVSASCLFVRLARGYEEGDFVFSS